MKFCVGLCKLQLTNFANFDTVSSPIWSMKRSLYIIFF